MNIYKHIAASFIEYYMYETTDVFWVYVDTSPESSTRVVRIWAMSLGDYKDHIPTRATPSSFLDILVVSGLTSDLLTTLMDELPSNIIVSFYNGNIHKKHDLLKCVN